MRLAFATILLPLSAVVLAGPVEDSGPGIIAERAGNVRLYRAQGFDHVALAGPEHMDIHVGPAFSVRATGPDSIFAKLRVVVENGGLKIEPRDENQRWSDEERALARQVRFVVALPRLTEVALAGSGGMSVDRVEGGDFQATLGGSGELALGRLGVSRAKVTLGGSGNITAAGRADMLEVTLGGSGQFNAPGLRAGRAAVMSAGSGGVRADVAGPATVRLAGSGSVDLGGGARCEVSRMGSGSVRCGG